MTRRKPLVMAFGDVEIATVVRGEVAWFSMKPIVDAMGLRWQQEKARVLEDEFLKGRVDWVKVEDGAHAQRLMLCIQFPFLGHWLFRLDLDRYRADAREAIVRHQREFLVAIVKHPPFKGVGLKAYGLSDWVERSIEDRKHG